MNVKDQNKKIIFGLKVKQLRREQGLSFSEFAEATSLSISYLNEIEKGKKFPRKDKIKLLAKHLGVPEHELTSQDLTGSLTPVGELLKSNFLNELPLDLFGIELNKVIEIIANAPVKVGAFISTLVELSRNYALQEENFYFGALRSYQELHLNYFEDLEEKADQFSKEHNLYNTPVISDQKLGDILQDKYKINLQPQALANHPELKELKAVFLPQKKQLLLHPETTSRQRAFIYAREIAFRHLNIHERPLITPLKRVFSFELTQNNFFANYFAAALMLNRKQIVADLKYFFSQKKWTPQVLVNLVAKHQISAEMLFHRLTSILPTFFGLQQLFFIRINNQPGKNSFYLDRVLHLDQQHQPHTSGINEHYCRRWLSINILKKLWFTSLGPKPTTLVADIQRSTYLGSDEEYLCISLASPSFPTQERNISVTIGLLINEHLQKIINFANDPDIPSRLVNKTCERCSITDCEERAALPIRVQEKEKWTAMQSKLKELMK